MHKLKSWLWPHKANNFHPYLLRPLGLGLVIAVLLSTNMTYNYSTERTFQVLGYATSISSAEIVALSNQQRASNGLPGFATNSKLNQAAQAKAQDMINRDYWSHYGPDGTAFWAFISNAGYSYSLAGENLAKDFNTSSGVVNAWMNSAGHRANVLKPGFSETGVAVINGIIQGQETTLVVAMYATPTAATPAPAPVAAAKPQSTPAPAAKVAPKQTTLAPAPAPEVVTEQPATPAPIAVVEPPANPPANPTATQEPAALAEAQLAGTTEGVTLGVEAQQEMVVREQMNWARSVAVFMLSVLLLVNILKHTVVWRTQRRGWRHIWMRAHPAAQYGLIILALVVNVTTSVGVIR